MSDPEISYHREVLIPLDAFDDGLYAAMLMGAWSGRSAARIPGSGIFSMQSAGMQVRYSVRNGGNRSAPAAGTGVGLDAGRALGSTAKVP
ncbi:hypothetical protein AWB67_05094 [Caballeronia terrestris]|uniref:Uncharacterized protein n=1 Tax=Caballeronia terrestris TaxID=1226301 RepID=A0A158K8K5_9BURK|nr:hypothetical protein AWB67_05094 [Caballeronia terrestris]